jgi:hypothetical protein
MDNVQYCDSYINTPSSQTYISYFHKRLHFILVTVVDCLYCFYLQSGTNKTGNDTKSFQLSQLLWILCLRKAISLNVGRVTD